LFACFGDIDWFATLRTPPLWQRGFSLVNCLVSRRLLASERSGVVKTFRWPSEFSVNSSWHILCENPKAIEAYYDSVPPLDDFDVHEISLLRDGPSLTFAGDVARFADKPSPRWDSNTNRVRLILSLWTVSELSLNGWATTNIGTLLLARADTGLTFRFANTDMQCSGNCEFAMIDQISGYTDAAV
jgi:hypothetical protein